MKTCWMLDDVCNQFSEQLRRINNMESFGSIELEVPIIHSGSIFYKMCSCNLKLPEFMYTHKENVRDRKKKEAKSRKIGKI